MKICNFENFIDNSHVLDECIVVGGKLENKMFLFKNRDRSFTPDSEIIREKLSNTEIVYYTDQTGWIEGMNEHGVGFVFSSLTNRKFIGYRPTYKITDEPKFRKRFNKFADKIKKVLISKNVEEAVSKILDSEKTGNFLVGDKNSIVELEIFEGKKESKKLDLDNLVIKSNHGELIPNAGHQSHKRSLKRGISSIRVHQAKLQLQGVTTLNDVPIRMKLQTYDSSSPLNVYRTDIEEHTISQCLMNLTDLKFYFFHDDSTADSVKLTDSVKDGKIQILIVES